MPETRPPMDVKLVVKKGAARKQTLRLRSEETILGRQHGCDLRIPSAQISRRHCRLSFRDGYLSVEDLESANGTFVNDIRVRDRQVLRPGDLLRVGPVTFLVEYHLTQAAVERMLREEAVEVTPVSGSEVPELSDVEILAEDPGVQEVLPVPDELDIGETVDFQFGERAPTEPEVKTPKGKRPKKNKQPPAEPAPPPPVEIVEDVFMFEEETPWEPPDEDIRDLLSGLEEE